VRWQHRLVGGLVWYAVNANYLAALGASSSDAHMEFEMQLPRGKVGKLQPCVEMTCDSMMLCKR